MRPSCRLRISFVAVALTLAVCGAAPLQAMHATGAADPWSFRKGDDGDFFSIGASAGQMTGTCDEKIFDYPHGRKFLLSELKWDYQNVTLAGVRASAGIAGRYRVNVGYWSAFPGGRGLMVDRDWIYSDAETETLVPDDTNWTHESRHPDTSLDGGTMFDLNLNILALRAKPFSLRGILGFRWDTWKWSARGGTYTYSDVSFRDTVAAFGSDEKAIEYKQKYAIPYLGLGGNWSTRHVLMDIHLFASPAIWASTTDYHNMRDTTFEGDYFGGLFVGLGMTATWAVTPRWAVTLRGEYQSISRLTGDVTVTTPSNRYVYSDGGGAGMHALLYSLETSYGF